METAFVYAGCVMRQGGTNPNDVERRAKMIVLHNR
jgi:hypothetical protein